jgi:hypothetical protein
VGATGRAAFFALHLAFAVAFSVLFYRMSVKRLSDRNARVALILFCLLPVSGTAYFWVGMDSITLLLLLVAFVFPARLTWAGLAGVLLGFQHFEQALIAMGALWGVLILRRKSPPMLPVTVPWCTVLLAGIVAGKLALTAVFHHYDVIVTVDRVYWVAKLLPTSIKRFATHHHIIIWSALALGWIVLIKYLAQGRKAAPFTLMLLGLFGVSLLAFDQTRVVAIVTFPLILVFWLHEPELLESLDERSVAWLALAWVVIPWSWVFGGYPQSSVLPHDLLFVIGGLTGWYEPPSDPLWPFLFVPPE